MDTQRAGSLLLFGRGVSSGFTRGLDWHCSEDGLVTAGQWQKSWLFARPLLTLTQQGLPSKRMSSSSHDFQWHSGGGGSLSASRDESSGSVLSLLWGHPDRGVVVPCYNLPRMEAQVPYLPFAHAGGNGITGFLLRLAGVEWLLIKMFLPYQAALFLVFWQETESLCGSLVFFFFFFCLLLLVFPNYQLL